MLIAKNAVQKHCFLQKIADKIARVNGSWERIPRDSSINVAFVTWTHNPRGTYDVGL